jgi:hypothetical protein
MGYGELVQVERASFISRQAKKRNSEAGERTPYSIPVRTPQRLTRACRTVPNVAAG